MQALLLIKQSKLNIMDLNLQNFQHGRTLQQMILML